MNRSDHLRAFPDSGGHPPDRTRAHVADSKHAAAVGFERTLPSSVIAPSADEAFPVQRHIALCETIRIWIGADEQKHVADCAGGSFTALAVAPLHCFESALWPY